jgi:hypothetical protein
VLENVADVRVQPDEEAQRHLDGEALRLVVESLDEREGAALKLRFDCQLSAKEVQEVLSVGEKLLELVVSTAYRKIAEQLEVGDDGPTTWMRRQRSLLLPCELGIASARQRRRAQRMLDRDPVFRGLLRSMRRGLDDVAAVLPVPIVADEHDRFRRLVGATGRLDELWAGARHVAERLTGRAVPDSNLVEAGVGSAGAGLTALAVNAVVCLDGSSHLTDRPANAAPAPRHPAAHVVEPPRDHVTVVRTPTKKAKTVTHTKTKTTTRLWRRVRRSRGRRRRRRRRAARSSARERWAARQLRSSPRPRRRTAAGSSRREVV